MIDSRIAIVIGGSEGVLTDIDLARVLVAAVGAHAAVFVVNDMIAAFPAQVDHAVTFHDAKLHAWLQQRAASGYAPPGQIWTVRRHPLATRCTLDWGGSSGLLAVKAAREEGFARIILCGVPMTVEDGHFVRRKPWKICHAFRRAWELHKRELAPFVRSCSGWTAQTFGRPSVSWLQAA